MVWYGIVEFNVPERCGYMTEHPVINDILLFLYGLRV